MNRLAEALLHRGVVDAAALDQAVARQQQTGQGLVQVLLDAGTVREQDVVAALAEQAGMPFVDLDTQPVDPSVVQLLPETVCRRHSVLPIGREGDTVLLATADPGNLLALDDAKALLGRPVSPVVATQSALVAAINRHLRSDSEIAGIG